MLAGPAHAHTKQAVLAYLESLCPDPGAVHLLLNSRAGEALAGLLVPRTAHSAAAAGVSEEVRCAAAGLLGLLIRHASAVSEGLVAAGLLDSLAAGVEPCAPPELQRRCAATLGELLFYVASQQRAGGQPGGGAWAVEGHHLAALLGLLGPGRDEVAQHYAAKASENICGLGGVWPARLATPDMQAALLAIVQRDGAGEGLRATAASALQRLLRCAPHLLEALLDETQGGLARLTVWLTDANPRVRQAGTTCLCQLLASDTHVAALVGRREGAGQADALTELTSALAALMDSQGARVGGLLPPLLLRYCLAPLMWLLSSSHGRSGRAAGQGAGGGRAAGPWRLAGPGCSGRQPPAGAAGPLRAGGRGRRRGRGHRAARLSRC